MFNCHYCTFSTKLFNEHLIHRSHHPHLNLTNRFQCGLEGCSAFLSSERLLRLHILRFHRVKLSQREGAKVKVLCERNGFGKYVCTVATCKTVFENHRLFIKHIKSHIVKQQPTPCPHSSCGKVYVNLASFTSHLSRIHRKTTCTINENPPLNFGQCEEAASATEVGLSFLTDQHENEVEIFDENINSVQPVEQPDEEMILHNMAQFCMKLEYKFLVPEVVVQSSMQEIFRVHELSKALFKENLKKNMQLANIPLEKINSIIGTSLSNDPIAKNFDSKLSTAYKRKNLFKEMYPFVQPEKVTFYKPYKNAAGHLVNVKKFFYYVPLKETIKACFADKSLNLKVTPVCSRRDGVIADCTDGNVFKTNKFFQDNPLCVRISLYQDGAEIVNPLGAAKTHHKILAVYMSILNLPDYLRSHINSIKLVALCKEKDFVPDAVYGRIVNDLKDMETVGVDVPGIGTVKVGLLYIAGDNLGSHGLGGFLENFSKTVYFCRYCELDRPSFCRPGGEIQIFPLRTVDSYNRAVELGRGKKYGYRGVKYNSVFNKLESFHVCNPGLTCCYAHDLMEGVICYDLKLFIDAFISKDWFTLHELNEAISSFKLGTSDNKDRPAPVQEKSTRIKGGAWQVWTLLRLLPLIIINYIDDVHDVHWKALMKLTEITEIVCAPEIHKSHLSYLHIIIQDYLTIRRELFPDVNLRPKHHFLSHYPWLIFNNGVLTKCFTLRFESKHSFFKRIARNIRNFKNILYSFSLKHELLQCYLRSGAEVVLPIEVFSATDFQPSHFNLEIVHAIRKKGVLLTNLQACNTCSLKGTSYRLGDIVVLGQDSYEENVSLGRIILFLYDCESMFFVCERVQTEYCIQRRIFRVGPVLEYVCVKPEHLLSYYPHNSYHIHNQLLVKLKHGLVCTPE